MPAITICAEAKTDADLFNLTQVLEKYDAGETLTNDESTGLQALTQICDIDIDKTLKSNVNVAATLLKIKNNFAEKSFASLASSPRDKFVYYGEEIVTGDGVCYSINMLDRQDLYKKEMARPLRYPRHDVRSNWTAFGYPEGEEALTYPIRILGSGKKAGMSLVLRMRKKDIDTSCKETAEGFRLALHTPDETPRQASHFYRIPFNAETLIAVQPRVMSTSDNLKQYPPKKRQCYFPGEKRLRFYKSYTQTNCKLECLTGEFKNE